MDPQLTEFRQTYDSVNFMMEDQKLPNSLRLRIREYLRESMHLNRVKSYDNLQARMSEKLRGEARLSALHADQ